MNRRESGSEPGVKSPSAEGPSPTAFQSFQNLCSRIASAAVLLLGLAGTAQSAGEYEVVGSGDWIGLTCSGPQSCEALVGTEAGWANCGPDLDDVSGEHTGGPTLVSGNWEIAIAINCEPSGNFSGKYLGARAPESSCPGGEAPPCDDPKYSLEPQPQKSKLCDKTNPCDPADGNKSQAERDYESHAVGGVSFVRYYNSTGAYKTGRNMPAGWRHSFSREINEEPDRIPQNVFAAPANQSALYDTAADACTSGWNDLKSTVWRGDLSTASAFFSGGNDCKIISNGAAVAYFEIGFGAPWAGFTAPSGLVTVSRPNGTSHKFEQSGSDWVNLMNPAVKLEKSGSNWIYTDEQDTQETFDSTGKLVSITYRNGQSVALTYDLSIAQGGDGDSTTLDEVTGTFGHSIQLAYDSNGFLSTLTTPDGTTQYAIGEKDNLESATYPDSSVRQYVYEDPWIPNHLTGIVDENGVRFATWDYDDAGRAIRSEHAGGKERIDLVYNSDGTTTITAADGSSRIYSFAVEQGEQRLASISGDVCSTCANGNIKSRDYDANGFVSETTDWNNNVTDLTRNSRGLVESRVEGSGSTEARTTSTIWHADYRLPTKVTSPKNVTDYTYDADGNVLTATISGDGKTRGWTFSYNADGQVTTINGPRTGVSDLTTLDYYTCTTGDECGQLESVTNALGHVTTYDSYDAAGRLTQMTDPNGLQISYTYDLRGRTLTVTETPTSGTARVSTMTYDDVGQLATYTLPNGTVLTYAYSDAHYLISVTDNLGNSIAYDYDSMGNLTDEDTLDPLASLKQSMDYVIDQNYRLDSATHGPVTTDLTFDLVGNLTQTTDGNSGSTVHAYDALNRLESTTDALSGVSTYDYDDHDNVTQVVAPNGATTTFAYDALDNLLSETSPDRGSLTYTYDDAGNRLTETDARGVIGTYSYDALNRPLSITYPVTAENVTFTYDDVASEGVGRLRSISDQAGSITYGYNEFGEVISDARQIGAFTHTTAYAYDAAGDISSMTYPSGRTVTYGRNAIGEITSVTSDKSGIQKSIVTGASYEPFGPVSELTYGNGVVFDYSYRTDYRTSDYSATGVVEKTYTYDLAGNIVTVERDNDAAFTHNLGYDALHRVTAETILNDYTGTILAGSPTAYWKLEELSSAVQAEDTTGNGHLGDYYYSPAVGTPGLIGSGFANGYGGGVVGPWFNSPSFTAAELWFKTDSVSSNRFLYQIYRSNTDYFLITHRTDGKVAVSMEGAAILESDAVVSTGVPHHVAVWRDASINTTYLMIDGVQQAGTFVGNPFDVFDPRSSIAVIQWNSRPNYSVSGYVDEVAIYSNTVDASTFSGRYAMGTSGHPLDNTFTYDANGNRTLLDNGSATTSYGVQASSNQLATIDGLSLTRDLSGNRTGDVGGMRTYTYNNANRLSSVADSGVTTASYVHNGLGQRSKKTVGGTDIVYLYDLAGNLIAEHDAAGAMIRDYVWMAGSPVAQIDAGEAFSYLHVDHLNTPRLATNDSQTVVWRWESDAFGSTLADEDPDGNLSATTVNLRFPGQYFDSETGFHYNYFRTLDPSTGRYLESDPIGFGGGLNTYSYVGANPLSWFDPFGLDRLINPLPGGPNGPSISFNNDVPGGPSTNLPVTDATAEMIEKAVVDAGFDININSTKGGTHSPTSRHPLGMACDINEVDGKKVDDPANINPVKALQDAFNRQPNIRENYGPYLNTKTESNGTVTQRPNMAATHQNHIHATGQK